MKSTQLGARSRPLSPRSASYLHAILRSALSQAVRDDLVSRNVCELVASPRADEAPFRGTHLEPDEARALLAAADGTRLSALWRLALTSGLRKGELLALRWNDFDLGAAHVRIGDWRFGGRCYRTPGDEWLAETAGVATARQRREARVVARTAVDVCDRRVA